jgi:hypothetical protein
MGIQSTRAGRAPRFVEQACVWSDAASEGDTVTQRARWEQGFLSSAIRYGLPLIGQGTLNPKLLWMGLHLLVPPLALLMPLGFAGLAVSGVLALLGGSALPFLILGVLVLAVTVAIFAAWHVNGRDVIPAGALLRIPLYILWKAGIYLRFFTRRGEKQWVRTARPGSSEPVSSENLIP